MSQAFEHQPVMVGEVVSLFAPIPIGLVVDATIGGGGHARALLEAHPQLRVLGIDRDTEALDAAREQLAGFGERVELRHARFDALAELVPAGETLSGVLLDLGVSSHQLDRGDRGFSLRHDALLDMRMDRSQPRTAADVVNDATEDELTEMFRDSGEGRMARRIAKAIVAARPIATTRKLAEVVERTVPRVARRRGHPATRVFQALRIAVNEELDVLPTAIDAAIERLAPGGRLVVISYHSGEDRLVKERFLHHSTGGCTCPPQLPCVCGAVPTVRLLNRGAVMPAADEVARNPRASAARLRAVERLGSVERLGAGADEA